VNIPTGSPVPRPSAHSRAKKPVTISCEMVVAVCRRASPDARPAATAISRRRSGVSTRARALPPSRPSACAALLTSLCVVMFNPSYLVGSTSRGISYEGPGTRLAKKGCLVLARILSPLSVAPANCRNDKKPPTCTSVGGQCYGSGGESYRTVTGSVAVYRILDIPLRRGAG